MMRGRFGFLKHLLAAIGVLLCLICAAELGLRYHAAVTARDPAPPRDSLLIPSWQCFQELKPLQQIEVPESSAGPAVTITTNSWGLRGAEPAVPKPADTYRILCLGDERVLASTLPESDTFCRRLEQELQQRSPDRVEVLNAGIPGHCPLLHLIRYRRQLMPLQPDLILVLVDFSDVTDDARYRRHVHTDPRVGRLTCPHPQLLQPKQNALQSVCREFKLASWCIDRMSSSLDSPEAKPATPGSDIASDYEWLSQAPSTWQALASQTLSPLVHLQGLARTHGSDLIVATFPCAWQLETATADDSQQNSTANTAALESIRSPFELFAFVLENQNLRAFDLSATLFSPSVVGRIGELYEAHGTRFSARGHAVYAEQLATVLEPGLHQRQPRSMSAIGPE